PMASARDLRRYLNGETASPPARSGRVEESHPIEVDTALRLLFFAGKGGVGKTTVSSSVALQMASLFPERRFTILSVDPAHSLRDVFERITPPANLDVEILDSRSRWNELRETMGEEISRAIGSMTPKGLSLAYDARVTEELFDAAPPGADEIFAIMRLADLAAADATVFVDTAPTGHFLRLLELPSTAGEWVREFMRLLLRYRELIPPGTLGERLLEASRSLKEFEKLLHSPRASAVVVFRPERIVVAETRRLLEALDAHGLDVRAVVANSVLQESDCACDRIERKFQLATIAALERPLTIVSRRGSPPVDESDLRELVPLRQTPLEMSDWSVYLYAVARETDPSVLDGVHPIHFEGEFRFLTEAGLTSICSVVPAAEFTQEEIDRRAADMEWIERIAFRHEGVLDALSAAGDVVPLRAFTLFTSEESVRKFLREQHEEILALLQRIEGRQEWTVRIEFDPEKWNAALGRRVPSLSDLEGEIAAAPAGKAYLLKKKAAEERKNAAEEAEQAVVEEIATELDRRLNAPMVIESRQQRAGSFPQIDLLVPRDGAPQLESVLKEMAGRYEPDGITLSLTGPWPSYSFTSEIR
ncbi:MAG: GvpL/GvpF family gas vesicle protein, partial [Thermoanaerobaculia bacterium]